MKIRSCSFLSFRRTLIAAALCSVCVPLSAADPLLELFRSPPETSRLQAWFHWNGDCVTKEGLIADLKAMGELDIGTAHIFLPAMATLPRTAVPLTDAWFDLFDTALREAKKNNVKLGFHNCPGWSSSGGPWITPEDSMKVMVVSETDTDVMSGTLTLPQPLSSHGFYRDIAVVAFPIPKQTPLEEVSGDFKDDFESFKAGKGPLTLPLGKIGATCSVILRYAEPISPKTFVYRLDDTQIYASCRITASDDGAVWHDVTSFEMKMFNQQKTPKTVRLSHPPQKARWFKLDYTALTPPPWIGVRPRRLSAVSFTDIPLIEGIDDRNSASVSFGYRPPRPGEEKRPGIARTDCVDLTDRMRSDGTLAWTAPRAGSWRVLRIGYTTTGKNCAPATLPGLECDKLSRKGLDAHWPHMPQRLINAPGAKGSVVISIIDSYEVGGQNWTERMADEFKTRRGYDLRPWLPALAGYTLDTAGETARFLYDFQRTVSDLFAENYYDYFTELCHTAGIEAASEPYGGPFDSFRCGATADVPTGEFWLGRSACGTPRLASSLAHLNGRPRAAAESFTTEAKEGRWQITPAEFKRCGDVGWLEGISQLVYHSYLHQPWTNVQPGLSLGRHGTQFNRNTTWWKEGIHWSRYVRRGQALLQRGKPRAEVLILSGESAPNGCRYPTKAVADGFNFDWCGVADLQRLENVGTGVAVPGQLPYEVLFLGPDRYLSIATLRKLRALADGGARIAGYRPAGSPSLSDCPEEWDRLADTLWPARIRPAGSAEEALAAFNVRPFADSKGSLRAIRRVMDGRDVYFVVNPAVTPFSGTVCFTGVGAPERWDAKDASVAPLGVVATNDPGRVRTMLDLPPHGSCFVVFDPSARPTRFVSEPKIDFSDVRILSARYQSAEDPARGRDVTDVLRRCLAGGVHDFLVTNAELGGDPAPNCPKSLSVRMSVDGVVRDLTVNEFGNLTLCFPRPRVCAPESVVTDLSTVWTASGFIGKNAPTGSVAFARLSSWSESSDPKCRYFAGRATYRKSFVRPEGVPGKRIVLDLGDVREIANVSLNGKNLGCLWEAPYRVDVTSALCPGKNMLEVEVINTWPNRLIGDALARRNGAAEPMSKKGPWPTWVLEGQADSGTGIYTWSNFDGWKADEPLLPAGLLGPVKLVCPEAL